MGAALAFLLGDAVLFFALFWAASAHGGAAVGAILSAIALTRSLFLPFGGAVGDRFGARHVMIVCDAATHPRPVRPLTRPTPP
ncbi:hypothetical protein [Streptoalloteichus tenebrarius]|uniref:hypothetical protein n=1 Tax=Streptoalloteichus tenebrarius (strain ATCC 17920 / DSM 40477 / JCM 4838 / CBS 697.72 / NBRC 16177 / NCIMB 11028 / NRRL B-12390 / A12253. 1 / ISP 5477) TaxID=1933 RepID=UPI0036D3A084